MKSCIICGKPHDNKRKTCSDRCKGEYYGKIQVGNERVNVDNQLIIKLYNQGKSTLQIGQIIGKDPKLIKRRLIKFGVKLRSLSEQLRISIKNSDKKHWNFPKNRANPSYRHGKMCGLKRNDNYYKKLTKNEFICKCNQCGSGNKLVVHHIDLNHRNNNKKNLQILCLSCHCKLHWMIKKQIKKQREEQ